MAAQGDSHAVRLMCRVLDVSPAGYYAWRTRGPSARAQGDAVLLPQVRAAHATSRGTYGAPRIAKALQHAAVPVGRHRVARLLRLAGLRGKAHRPAQRAATTQLAPPVPAPNRLARAFAPGPQQRAWVADLTQLRTREGWAYLAVVLDLASRRCLGWAVGAHPDARLAQQAYRMALELRQPAPGWLVHSDRGSPYTALSTQALVTASGAHLSMSQPATCADNAVVESFFATLKTELWVTPTTGTRAELRTALMSYIEGWYNHQRLHSSLGYLAPVAYERRYLIA